MTPKQKKNRKQMKNTQKNPKDKGKATLNPNLLPLTQLEPTHLASKLIEHSRILTSLLPFFLGAETECYPSSTKVKKSRKPFSDPLKEIPIERKHDLASCTTLGYTTTPPPGSTPFEDSPTPKTQED
jgi:hypothetical protein